MSKTSLFLFNQFAQTLSRIFTHGFEFSVRTVAFGEIRAVFLTECAHTSIAALLADLAVLITFSTIETFWIMFIVHIFI